MIDLTGKSVFVRTQEEYLSVLKIARLQGFIWAKENHLNPIEIPFPNILNFYNGKDVTCRNSGKTLYEASELLETKEMTAREFAEWYANTCSLCENRECSECVLSKKNTKRNESLCEIVNWKDNIDEILEIAASGRITVSSPEEKTIITLESFIENPDRAELNDEFVDALKLAVEKLKEVK
nr:MAG TPA: hypothetical protein [Caudoviricetes sp.]